MTNAQRPSSEAIQVVIIDDHQMFVQAISQLLERHDDIAISGNATTAAEGMTLVAATEPSVAIVDFQLPDRDGASLAREIGRVSPHTRVLILSGSSDERSFIAAIDAGCAGFLTKDKAADTLVAAVRSLDTGEPYIEPALLTHLLPRVKRNYRRVGDDLTRRETEVLRLMTEGLSNQAIAQRLMVSVHTIRNHVQKILDKLHAHSKLEAVAIAGKEGLLDRDM